MYIGTYVIEELKNLLKKRQKHGKNLTKKFDKTNHVQTELCHDVLYMHNCRVFSG